MNELVIGGAVIGGLYYMTQAQIGVKQEEHAGSAVTAAMRSLLSSRPVAGVSWSQDPALPLSATANFAQMTNAMVGQFGALPGYKVGPSAQLPNNLTNDQLVGIATAWLAAYDAGRNTSHENFGLYDNETAASAFASADCRSVDTITTVGTQLSSIGRAACALASYRDQLQSGAASTAFTDTGETTSETFRLINALASEMDGADYTVNGVRNSEQGWQWSDIPGGLAAGASASVGVVEGLAGDAAGALGGAIVGSDLFWLAALAFAGYMVLR